MLPPEWNWVYVPPRAAAWWTRTHGKTLSPGRYGSGVMRQHVTQYCGSCFLNSVLQMLQDRLNVGIAIRRAEEGRVTLVNGDHALVEVDQSRALHEYSLLKREEMNADQEDVLIGRPSVIRNWTACMGGSHHDVCRAIEEGTFVPRTSPLSDWTGVVCTAAALADGGGRIRVRKSAPMSSLVDLSSRGCVDTIARILLRDGPVAVAVDSKPILLPSFTGSARSASGADLRDHVVVIVGWTSKRDGMYWVARNSWGEDDSIQMPSRPHASPYVLADCLMECSSISRAADFCSKSTWTWKGTQEDKGYFLILSDFKTNALNIYSQPCGWAHIFPET